MFPGGPSTVIGNYNTTTATCQGLFAAGARREGPLRGGNRFPFPSATSAPAWAGSGVDAQGGRGSAFEAGLCRRPAPAAQKRHLGNDPDPLRRQRRQRDLLQARSVDVLAASHDPIAERRRAVAPLLLAHLEAGRALAADVEAPSLALRREEHVVVVAADERRDDYHVFLTAEGEGRGLYVSRKGSTGFEVREQQRGDGTASFSYRVVARRKDIDGARLEKVALPSLSPERVGIIPEMALLRRRRRP